MFVVAYGNPFDSVSLVGPFGDEETAMEHAEKHSHGETWNVVRLTSPEKDAEDN